METTVGLRTQHVSAGLLTDLGACKDQVMLYNSIFGDGIVEIAPDAIRRAAIAGLDITWVAQRVLADSALQAYSREHVAARREFDRAVDAARKEFYRDRAAAWMAANEDVIDTRHACCSKEVAAHAEYEKVVAAQEERVNAGAVSLDEYRHERLMAMENCSRVGMAAWAECTRAIALRWQEYDRELAVLRRQQDRKIAAAREKYLNVCAEALIRVVWGADAGENA
jgi:hypothetical protein